MVILRHRVVAASGLACVVALAGALGGCASSGSTGPARPARNLTAAEYYPLTVGWKWAYDVEKDGQRILAVYSVLERIGETAVVQAGDDRLTYAVTAQGIAQRDGGMVGDFVLKDPVKPGGTWPVAGGTARVSSTSEEVTVGAGKYSDCVVVEVTRQDPLRVTRTTFAPGIGPAALELQVQVAGQLVTSTRASLRSVTKPGEDLFQ